MTSTVESTKKTLVAARRALTLTAMRRASRFEESRPMSHAAVDQLVYLLDEAFEGKDKPWHSMLGNLASATEDDWLWVPPDGVRTIRQITGHVGGAAYLYYDRAFGGCAVFGEPITSWNVPAGNLGVGTEELDSVGGLENEPAMADVVAWATERARAFRDAVAQLDDDGLMEERTNHRGEVWPLRLFAGVTIQHYAYHAGEINHIRALHQRNDG
jgi:hypothetical protein